MDVRFDFAVLWEYRWALSKGLGMTLFLSTSSIVTGTLLAFPITMALLSTSALLRIPANIWVQVIRAIPILVLLVGAYYVAPSMLGIRLPPSVTAWIVFSIYLSAFVADVFRSSVLGVPRDYREAALAIGMSAAQVRWRIVVPESLRRALPALTALFIGLFKYSTVASVVAVDELMHTAELIMLRNLRPVEAFSAVAMLFVLVLVPAGLFARWFGNRLNYDGEFGKVL
jgi:polar amino acid transport system permease protein